MKQPSLKYVSASPMVNQSSSGSSPTLKKGGIANTSAKYLPNATGGFDIKLEPLTGNIDPPIAGGKA